MSAWRKRNPEKVKKHLDDWRMANPDKFKASCDRWRASNQDKCRESVKRWMEADPERAKEMRRLCKTNRRARKLSSDGSFTSMDLDAIRKAQRGRCALCGKLSKRLEADHIHPLFRGGSNYRRNIQLLCRSCNAKKGRSDPLDYLRSTGRLL